MVTNRRLVESNSKSPDFYPTPSWATHALVKSEPIIGNIWEPACGDGAISDILIENGYNVYSSDLYDQGYNNNHGIDFLTQTCKDYDNIITNPPFILANDFVERGLDLAKHKLILLLRLAFVESVSRYDNIYSKNPPATIWIFSQRLSMYPKDTPVKGGGTTAYGWFVWDKQNITKETKLKWIPPGFKKQ